VTASQNAFAAASEDTGVSSEAVIQRTRQRPPDTPVAALRRSVSRVDAAAAAARLHRETHQPAFVERNSAARLLAFPHRWVMPCGSRKGNGSAPGVRGSAGRPARWGGGRPSNRPSWPPLTSATARRLAAPSTEASTNYADIEYGGVTGKLLHVRYHIVQQSIPLPTGTDRR
jgi:hypothetical protein